jgi:DNA modification methylase
MQNTLFTEDNLYILNGLNSEIADLIYLDPPFNSKRTYSAPIGSKSAGASFKDMWTWQDVNEAYLDKLIEGYPMLVDFINSIEATHSKAMKSYITYMTQRIIEMHRVLKETGSIYLHCDPTASHYLKIVLDSIFGRDNFRNEIVWCYSTPTTPYIKQFPRNTDVIYWYSKSKKWTFNKEDIRVAYKGGSPHGGKGWQKDGESLEEWRKKQGEQGKIPFSWWSDIYKVNNKERTGYPTQKPLALLDRIIKTSSNEGDLVLDPFCGCATTCVSAKQLNRKWIGIDIEAKAVDILIDRLTDLFSQKDLDFIHRKDTPQRTDIPQVLPTEKTVKEQLFKEQNGHCKACDVEMRIVDFEVDHIIPKAKGGGNYYENYQLLCASCNRIKGARPMEYLRAKIVTRAKYIKKIQFGE